MENKSLTPYSAELERQNNRAKTGEIVTLPPELAGLQEFYTLLRQSTFQTIELAEKLINDDPDSPDPKTDPSAHKDFAMHKYGIHLPLPNLPVNVGHYSLAKLRFIAESTPINYSPGFKSANLEHLLGLKDPLIAIFHSTIILIDQAETKIPLRPVFKRFPAQELFVMEVYPEKIVVEDAYKQTVRNIIHKIDQFRRTQLRKIIPWQQSINQIIDMGPNNAR